MRRNYGHVGIVVAGLVAISSVTMGLSVARGQQEADSHATTAVPVPEVPSWTEFVGRITIFPDGGFVARGTNVGLGLFRIEDGSKIECFRYEFGDIVDIAPNGKHALLYGDPIRLWDLRADLMPKFQTSATIGLWDLKKGQMVRPSFLGESDIRWMRTDARFEQLATLDQEGTVRVWDLSRKCLLQSIEPRVERVRTMQFSGDGSVLTIIGARDESGGHLIDVWQLAPQKLLAHFGGPEDFKGYLAVDRTGKVVAVALSKPERPTGVIEWPARMDRKLVRIWRVQTKTSVNVPIIDMHGLVLSPDGKTLAKLRYGAVHVMDATTGQKLGTISNHHLDSLLAVAFNSNDEVLAASRYGHLLFWDVQRKVVHKRLTGLRLEPNSGMPTEQDFEAYLDSWRKHNLDEWKRIRKEELEAKRCVRDNLQTPMLSGKTTGNFDLGVIAPTQLPQITNSIGMKLKLIPAGEFMMGSPADEEDRADNETQHRVRITKPYYLGVYEVTQAEYEKVIGENPSSFKGSTHPVTGVSSEEAAQFCRKLSAQDGRTYRLPTEAEWEYACRAGTTTPFHFGRVLNGTQANCKGDYPYGTKTKGPNLGETTTVGSYAANAWGLYDMHGNVWEWCQDWWDSYEKSPMADPTGPPTGSIRVFRGGGWNYSAWGSRSAFRGGYAPDFRGFVVGFRVVSFPKNSSEGDEAN